MLGGGYTSGFICKSSLSCTPRITGLMYFVYVTLKTLQVLENSWHIISASEIFIGVPSWFSQWSMGILTSGLSVQAPQWAKRLPKNTRETLVTVFLFVRNAS